MRPHRTAAARSVRRRPATIALVGARRREVTLAQARARFYDRPPARSRSTASTCARSAETTCAGRSSGDPENYLFSGTVASNIAFGRPGATRAEIEARPRRSADAFIRSLPDGYDTDVRKRGEDFRPGTAARGFAAGLPGRPAVLILDEATSSLDIRASAWCSSVADDLSSRTHW